MSNGWQVAVALVAAVSLIGNGVALAVSYQRWAYKRKMPKRTSRSGRR